jgi:hypothetical protein
METPLQRKKKILHDFLALWTSEKVASMSLEEYVDVDNPNTFCQWLGHRTQRLGSIRGQHSNMFGIYKRQGNKPPSPTLVSDEFYSWRPSYGRDSSDRQQAFLKVKQEIIAVINAAKSGNFTEIDKIKLHRMFKWKIAFLYSNEKLVPIFEKPALVNIATHFGLSNAGKLNVSELQNFLFSKKPETFNIFQFMATLYRDYEIQTNTAPAYYLIGSKYGDHNNIDMLPQMESAEVICTGYASEYNLAHLYRASEDEIMDELKSFQEPKESYNILKQFLQMKPGDMIAIKSAGNPVRGKAFLEIVAYAVVVERNGSTYWHDDQVFGHCINVEFIETGLNKQLNQGGYSKTLQPIKNADRIKQFFGENDNADSEVVRRRIRTKRRTRKGINNINTDPQVRGASSGCITNPIHNLIQEAFFNFLERKYPGKVQAENNYVDIKLFQDDCITFYEVKPNSYAEDCIRNGLGQLLSYAFHDTDDRQKKIRIVGPYSPEPDEMKFISYLKKSLSVDFDYESYKMNPVS